MASIRRAGSGMSKWVPCSSAMVVSAKSCIQARSASRPTIRRCGSASSAAAASATDPPGTIFAATRRISCSILITSAQPQA